MSLIRRIIRGGRSFCTAVPRKTEDILINFDYRSRELCSRVKYLVICVGDIDTAARYSRMAVFSRRDDEPEITSHTCETIIRSMVRDKRHKDAYDLYDYFFNKHMLKPNSNCCNHVIESRLQQSLVDEALSFHMSIKRSIVPDYPTEATLRVLTKGLVHSGRFDLAQDFLIGSSFKGFDQRFPDHVAFNNLIQGFLDLGNFDKANHLLQEFKRWFSSSVALYKSTYDSFYNQTYPRYGNSVAFLMATFMDYWFKQGKEVEAMDFYNQSVLAKKLLLCPETGNAFLKVLLKHGQKSHAWALYNDMLAQSATSLDSVSVQIMVNECFDMGRCSDAMDTYYKARAKYNYLSNGYIIQRCCENGMLSEAESLLAYSIGPGDDLVTDTTFKTIIDAYIKAGRIDDALKTSNKMFDVALKKVSEQFFPL